MSDQVGNPEDRFSHDEAQISLSCLQSDSATICFYFGMTSFAYEHECETLMDALLVNAITGFSNVKHYMSRVMRKSAFLHM